ncbi:MAG: GatB/YqeY domain-containing protein [Acidobacteria bacterium]|nr:MAG: GatB/YqeY domain-containing protein [Acidobacteriota bacterium]
MGLQQRINEDLVAAMKSKDARRLSTLRMMKAALKNRQVDLQRDLDDAEVIKVLKSLIKQRQDSAEQYRQAGRTDLAQAEEEEIAIIKDYMPPELSQQDIERIVDETIQELGASSLKDMGPVMKAVMGRLATALVDGKLVSHIVRSKLSQGRQG